jgi:transcriptional regulator with XRE-family HTH domain
METTDKEITMSTQNVMPKVRALVKKSGLTQQVIGEKMGYLPKSARQSVSQFLKSEDPTLRVVVRFAKAMNVSVESLL